MKKLLILSAILLLSCVETPKENISKVEYIYKEGQPVYVEGKQFIVVDTPFEYRDTYILKLVDCKSEYCNYYVLEEYISDEKPNNYESN